MMKRICFIMLILCGGLTATLGISMKGLRW